jgi:hypothetical protein
LQIENEHDTIRAMKTTYREIINFANAASRWLAIQEKEKQPQTKLSYAVARMLKRCQKPLDDYNGEIEDLRLDHALEDEKTKAVLRDEAQQYKFSKQGLKTVIEKQRELLEKEIEIEPYIATALPASLNDDVKVAFEGFVMEKQEE